MLCLECAGTGGSIPSLSAESESNLKQNPVSQHLQGFLMRNILQKEAKKRSFSVDYPGGLKKSSF